jgi:ABC-type branched-subunit amino acid transport system ATPase component
MLGRAEFGLDAVRDQLAGRLPAGQQRLVELARAAASKPKLLGLDEPSSGLSSDEVTQLMAELRRLNKRDITILLVSHDMELMAISSVIHVLCFGEIIASGGMAEVQANPRVREAYNACRRTPVRRLWRGQRTLRRQHRGGAK